MGKNGVAGIINGWNACCLVNLGQFHCLKAFHT